MVNTDRTGVQGRRMARVGGCSGARQDARGPQELEGDDRPLVVAVVRGVRAEGPHDVGGAGGLAQGAAQATEDGRVVRAMQIPCALWRGRTSSTPITGCPASPPWPSVLPASLPSACKAPDIVVRRGSLSSVIPATSTAALN